MYYRAPEPGILQQRLIVLHGVNRWDVFGWSPEPVDEDTARSGYDYDNLDDQAKEWLGAGRKNPFTFREGFGHDFVKKREEAVVILRDEPERFDELYGQALQELQGDEVWLNLLQFPEDDIFCGDGEVGWRIRRDDLLAGRFDRVRYSHNC